VAIPVGRAAADVDVQAEARAADRDAVRAAPMLAVLIPVRVVAVVVVGTTADVDADRLGLRGFRHSEQQTQRENMATHRCVSSAGFDRVHRYYEGRREEGQ